MANLKLIYLAIVCGISLNQISSSADEKFTLLKYNGLEIKYSTFDSLLKDNNPFIVGMLKQGISVGYQQFPQTLDLFLPKDSFLIDLVFQYANPFFTFFMNNEGLPKKLEEIIFLKSLGISFPTTDVSQISDKEVQEAKNKVIHSFFPNITDAQLQRFYGTIITNACTIEGLSNSDSSEAFQARIDSLNKGEKKYKITIEPSKGRAFKLKEENFHSRNMTPLLSVNVGQYVRLESATPFYRNQDIYQIKKIQLAPLAQVQKYRAAMKAKLVEVLGNPLYDFKKAVVQVSSHYQDLPEKEKTYKLSSDLPIIKNDIQLYYLINQFCHKFGSSCCSTKENFSTIDPFIPQLIKGLVQYCNETDKLTSIEEIKKDRNGVRIHTLANIILNELSSPLFSQINATKEFSIKQRIKYLEVLKEVQCPASMHLLLAQLYSQIKDPKAKDGLEEYLKKDGLSQVSYLPLTKELIEERAKKVESVIGCLQEKKEDLKTLLEDSKSKALQKAKL